jgi:hypothetical protein
MGAYAGPNISEDGLVLALDAANKKSYSQNEFQYSTDIFAWSGTSANAATLSRDTISSPVGNTPLKMEVTGDDPYTGTYNSATWNIAPAANGQTWVVSVYVKATVATTGEIFIFGANSSGTGFVNSAWLTITSSNVNIGTEWTRVSHTITMANADIAYIHTRLDGTPSGGAGITIWWDGLQVERVPSGTTTPTPFTSAYYGGSVYRDLVGSNNGTLVNYPTYNSSGGESLSFDGVDDYVEVSTRNTNLEFQPTQAFSVFVWIYNLTDSSGAIVSNMVGSSPYPGWDLWRNGGGTIAGHLISSWTGNAIKVKVNFDHLSNTNKWVNIGYTYNGSSPANATDALNSMNFYINGQLTTSGKANESGVDGFNTTTETISYDSSQRFRVASRWASGSYSQGSLLTTSNISIYNRALTASEIQQNFNATRGRFGV